MSTATYHIFYNSDGRIIWSTTAIMDDAMITVQTEAGYTHLQANRVNTPLDENYWIVDETVTAKNTFSPTYSTILPELDAVINVTGVPAGTEVFLDNVSAGTMSDTTLTITATEPGKFIVKLTKLGYIEHSTTVNVQRVAT